MSKAVGERLAGPFKLRRGGEEQGDSGGRPGRGEGRGRAGEGVHAAVRARMRRGCIMNINGSVYAADIKKYVTQSQATLWQCLP